MGDSDKKPEKGIDMDDTLKKLFDALKNYDEYLVENEYDKLKYENYHFLNLFIFLSFFFLDDWNKN